MPAADTSSAWLVAGLGNPGARYEGTRHNVGWLALDALRPDPAFREEAKFEGFVARADGAWLLKPTTFMNLSGVAVRTMADFYKIPHGRVLVVFDDAALPFGRLRIRASGSAGSHNGLESVLLHFATESVPRLRIGVGAPPEPVALHDHVLGAFTPAERAELPSILDRAASAIRVILKNGLAAAMNEFNKEGS
ncbi:MAG: aminoacyl-tRNA hydrolase [Chthoniobacterales bacterium]|nr:aminoacyl-tRNA hydrolase [Chthoniobacterales bacterium]